MALTGRFRFRRSLMGSVILQLEHDKWAPWPLSIGGKRRRCWRDASIVDLLAPQIHGLVGLEHFVEEFPNANHGALTPPLARRRLPQREQPPVPGRNRTRPTERARCRSGMLFCTTAATAVRRRRPSPA